MSDQEEKPHDVVIHEILGNACATLNGVWHSVRLNSSLDSVKWEKVPAYSSDCALAWSLVEKMLEVEYCKVVVRASHFGGYFCIVTAPHESQRDQTCLVKRDASSIRDPKSSASLAQAVCAAFIWSCKP